MIRNNKFFVKKYDEDENKITLEEERKYHSPFVLFLIKNGRLLLAISLLLSVSVFIIAITLIFGNMKESSIVMYEQNGVVVSFDGDDNSIVNGTPITKEYAEKEQKKLEKQLSSLVKKIEDKIQCKVSEKQEQLSKKEEFERLMEQNEKNLAWLASFNEELDSILKI